MRSDALEETEAVTRPRPLSMISWVEGSSDAPGTPLTWDLDDEGPLDHAATLLDEVVAVGDRDTIAEALPDVACMLVRRCGGEIAAISFESTLPGGARLVAAARGDGFDAALSSGLATLASAELADAITTALPESVVRAWELPVGARATCIVWLARDGATPELDAGLARAAGLALRGVLATEALAGAGTASPEPVRRDRREAIIGRLARAAVPSLVATHASIASVQASLAAELAELRMTAPRHASIRASAALLQEASVLTHGAWQVVSGVACLGDDASPTCDPAQVIQSAVALAAPYLASRVSIEVVPARLPLARVTPAVLAEAVVVFLTRTAQRFVERGERASAGRLAVSATAGNGAVEVEVRALTAPDQTGGREHDEVVADTFHRLLSERVGGSAELVREASGATRFRLTVHAA
jgi:hypothetical protein